MSLSPSSPLTWRAGMAASRALSKCHRHVSYSQSASVAAAVTYQYEPYHLRPWFRLYATNRRTSMQGSAGRTSPGRTTSASCRDAVRPKALAAAPAAPATAPAPAQVRMYKTTSNDNTHSAESVVETAILSAALSHVPRLGFTHAALTQGALDQGYLPATANNLLPRGAFDVFLHHLRTQRLALKRSVQFLSAHSSSTSPTSASAPHGQPPSTSSSNEPASSSPAERVRSLLVARIQANEPIANQLTSALALASLPSNLPSALHELSLLADEILFLAGDTSLDSGWYTKRAAVGAIYAATEIFQSQDSSVDFSKTLDFLHRRIDEATVMKHASDDFGQWCSYTAHSTINVLRSKGFRI